MQRMGTRPALINMENAGGDYRNSRAYNVQGGIAIIDISGPLSNEDWSWGGATYGEIQSQVEMAVDDRDVEGILLCLNSPGGSTDRAFETAAVVALAGEQKPVY